MAKKSCCKVHRVSRAASLGLDMHSEYCYTLKQITLAHLVTYKDGTKGFALTITI